jgi:AcrR family transcriptional regulator
MADSEPVPRRADAQRNRQRVLDAAVEVFDAEGLGAQMEAVAHRAGVGVGTVYRHFPTKEELVRAVISLVCEHLLTSAEAALAEPDPGQGFRAYFSTMVEFQAQHRVLAEEMASQMELDVSTVRLKESLRTVARRLLERAQAAGEVRADVGVADISMLLVGMAQAVGLAADEPELRQRYLEVLLDGLSPLGAQPLPGRALGYDELDVLQARRSAQLERHQHRPA